MDLGQAVNSFDLTATNVEYQNVDSENIQENTQDSNSIVTQPETQQRGTTSQIWRMDKLKKDI